MKKEANPKTAGKRTARPGSRSTDSASNAAVKSSAKLVRAGGRGVVQVTEKHITGHRRASGQRKHNPKSKSK